MNTPASPIRVLFALLRRFGPYLRQHAALLAAGLVGLLAEVVLRLIEPWSLKVIFDGMLVPHSSHGLAYTLANAFGNRELALLCICGFVIAIAGLRALAAYRSTVCFASAGSRVLSTVRSQLFRHLQCLSLSFHHRSRSGDLVMRVVNDVNQLQDALVTALIPMLAKTLLVGGMVVLMLVVNVQLACIAMVLLPLFWLRGVRLSRRIHDAAKQQRRREGEMAATAAECLGAAQVVQALSLEGRFSEAFTARTQNAVKEDVRGKRLSAQLERSVDLFIAVATALVLWQGTRLVWEHRISPGDLLVFLAYLKTAFRPLQDFAKYSSRMAKAAAAADRVLIVLKESALVHDRPGAVTAARFGGTVEFDNVSFHYPVERKRGRGIENVNLTIRPGELVALVGHSGSGKSTILALLSRLYDPQEGEVRIDGKDIRDFTVASVRSQVSVVLQDTGLFATTVTENIRAGRAEASDLDVEAAARLVNAHEFIANLPEGYQTVLGERGVTLSQGQRQRIALARAALRKAPILLLDEPTNGLDEANTEVVFEALKRLSTSCTTILATHDMRQAAEADLVVRVENGRIVSAERKSERCESSTEVDSEVAQKEDYAVLR